MIGKLPNLFLEVALLQPFTGNVACTLYQIFLRHFTSLSEVYHLSVLLLYLISFLISSYLTRVFAVSHV